MVVERGCRYGLWQDCWKVVHSASGEPISCFILRLEDVAEHVCIWLDDDCVEESHSGQSCSMEDAEELEEEKAGVVLAYCRGHHVSI